MTKNNRPTIDNPLAGMGLDDLVRGITAPKPAVKPASRAAAPAEVRKPAPEPEPVELQQEAEETELSDFEQNLRKYTGISEQGVAIWLPKEVKKQLEMIRINASRTIPLRSLAAAIIMTYIAENEDMLNDL